MISVSAAREIILNSVSPVKTEVLPIDLSYYRVIAEDIVAPHDVPFFDNSSMDGFALRAQDTVSTNQEQSLRFFIQGEVQAGDQPKESLRSNSTIRIMTGAPIPNGADTVVEQELVDEDHQYITLKQPLPKGKNIRRRGEDVASGNRVMHLGEYLTPFHVGVLASMGIRKVNVFQKPSVSILTTGNEIIDITKQIEVGKVYNSNRYTLQGLVMAAGGTIAKVLSAPDDEKMITDALMQAMESDIVITSGGISVGKYDAMLRCLEKIGVELKFSKVNMKPGKPFAFGVTNSKKLFFALPGNPVSSGITFLAFVQPALYKMCHRISGHHPMLLKAILQEDIKKTDNKFHFVRGRIDYSNGDLRVKSTGSQSSGILSSLASANCLIHLPEERRDPKIGEIVEIQLL